MGQRGQSRHSKCYVGKAGFAFLQVTLKPPHRDLRMPARLLLRDQDRQLERLGQTDPAELARQSFGDDKVVGL